MSLRGFRYQTGECEELAQVVKQKHRAEADIDLEEEINIYFEDLPAYGVYSIEDAPLDETALDKEEHPEFFARGFFTTKQGASLRDLSEDEILTIDFFLIEEEEESYDDIFLG